MSTSFDTTINNKNNISEVYNYYNEIKDKYPVTDSVRIHLSPTRKIIFGKIPKEKRKFTFEPGDFTVINDNAYSILCKSDGTQSVDELINSISKDYTMPITQLRDNIAKFYYYSEKIYNHIQFLQYRLPEASKIDLTGDSNYYMPIHYILELTNNCNMNCVHCYRLASHVKPTKLSLKEVKRIIDTMYEHGARTLELTGGEFTLHPDYVEIIKYAYDKMDLIALLSHGYNLTEKAIEELSYTSDKVLWSISLDSYDPEFHDAFRGVKGSHKRVCDNVKRLVAEGFQVKISMSLVEDNFDHVIPTIDFVHNELGVAFFGCSPVLAVGKGSNLNLLKTKTRADFDKIYEYSSSKYNNFLSWKSKEELHTLTSSSNNCGAGWKTICIGPTGTIRPCVMMDEGLFDFGNILTDDFKSIMKKSIVSKLHNISMPLEKDCSDCFNLLFCKYCFFRGILTNIERQKQGIGFCQWANKYDLKINENIQADITSCEFKHCSF